MLSMAELDSALGRMARWTVRFLGVILSVAAVALSSTAWASSAGSGYVSHIIINDNGVVLFTHSGTRTSPPSCSGATLGARWAFDGSTAAGQAKLAALLSAYGLHKQISILGAGACPVWGDTESVTFFEFQD
jgi:hypothetical protein